MSKEVKKTDVFKQYAELDQKIKGLKDEQAKIKPKLMEELETVEGQKLTNNLGMFTMYDQPTWKYSEETTALMNVVKAIQEKEKEDGVATPKPSIRIKFTIPKLK